MPVVREVGAALVRLPVEDHAFALSDPEELEGRNGDGPRWWLVRERLLEEMNAGRIAPVLTGFQPRGVVVEARVGGPPVVGGRKAWRFGLSARHGRLWLGDPGRREGEGAWLSVPSGSFVADVALVAEARYRVRLVETREWPLPPTGIPHLGPRPERWDHTLTRSSEVEAILDEAARAQEPAQAALAWRLSRHDRFELDLETGRLSLLLDGRETVQAPVHVIGTRGDRGGFRWAWANPSISMSLTERSRRAQLVGLQRGIEWLVEPEVELPPEDVRRLVALATRAMGMDGWYPAPYEQGVMYVALDAPTGPRSSEVEDALKM